MSCKNVPCQMKGLPFERGIVGEPNPFGQYVGNGGGVRNNKGP